MATDAGAPIVVDDFTDFQAEIDALQAQVTALSNSLNGHPVGYLGHTFLASDQLIANSSGDFAADGVSFFVGAGRRVKTTWMARITSSAASDEIGIKLVDDDTSSQLGYTRAFIPSSYADEPGALIAYTEPSAGFHTYRIYCSRPFGSGTGGYRGGGLLIVEDIGAH